MSYSIRIEKELSWARKEHIDLILMDLAMPDMDGVTAIKLIRQTLPDVPAIIVTGFGEEDDLKEALAVGANTVMGKPLDFARLFTYIQTICVPDKH